MGQNYNLILVKIKAFLFRLVEKEFFGTKLMLCSLVL